MKLPKISRRDVLKGSAAVAAGTFAPWPVLARRRPPHAITPELIEAAKKEGNCAYYTSVDLPLAEKIAQAFEAKFSGVTVRVERTRRRARVPAHRPGVRQQDLTVRCRELVRRRASHRLEARMACWRRSCPRTWPNSFRAEHKDPDGMFASFRLTLLPDRLQHQAGEGGGGAQELQRPARPEVDGQDRQGASGL